MTRHIAGRLGLRSAPLAAVLRALRADGAVRSTGRTSATRWSLADDLDVQFELRSCRVCGCTDDDCSDCIEATGFPCVWVGEDLCSRCVEDLAVRRLEGLALEAERTAAHLRECVAAIRAPMEAR